jgi:hypothetical protein
MKMEVTGEKSSGNSGEIGERVMIITTKINVISNDCVILLYNSKR